MNCSKIIAMNIGDSCSPIVKGYKNEAVIINFDDIDFDAIQYDETNKHVVKSLTLKESSYAYKVIQRGAQPFNGTNSAMAQATYQNDVTKTVSIVIPKDAENTDKVGQPLVNGATVVVILESKSKGSDGNSAFEIIGLDGGLTATSHTDDINGDAGKNYIFTLTEVTSTLAYFLNAGTYASTKLMVDGLVKSV